MRAAALLLTLVLIATACGGGDSEPETSIGGDDSGQVEASGDGGAAEGAADDDGSVTSEPGEAPGVGDHWHAAYGIFICGQFTDPIPDESDPEGIHSHGDGVIHIHPFQASAAGANATIGKFMEAVQVQVTDDGLFGVNGSLEEGGSGGEGAVECPDGPAEFTLARWSLLDIDAGPTLIDTDIADVRFTEDLEVFTFGFVPDGTELPLPPSVANLGTISDVAPEDVPELPPGFTVATVDPPEPGETIDGDTECPPLDGTAPRVTEFSAPPPMCIDPAKTYEATFVTNYGDVVVELDTESTPQTANNFVVLAAYHYYDNTQLFRTAPSMAIIQGGAPHTNSAGDPGPGYTIADEGDGYTYAPGDIAMARTPAPDSASAQFFFSAGPETANLDGEAGNPDGSGRGTYVNFGTTVEGLDVLEEILSLHLDSTDPSLAGGGPSVPVILETVTITER